MDEYSDCGPVGGLCAGLKKCQNEIVLVAACDMPFLKGELFHTLYEFLDENCDGVVPLTEGRMHPLAAIYRRKAAKILEQQIRAGQFRMTEILKHMQIRYVDVSDQPELCKMLQNINTIEEYEGVKRWKD